MNQTPSNLRLKESLEELARYGSPVDVSVAVTAVENEKLEIEQLGGIYLSHLFELEDGRIACMADIAVTNHTARTIDVINVELRALWDNIPFQWLQPRQFKFNNYTKRGRSHLGYRFPGHGPEFEFHEVINHRLLESKKLAGKRRLEGWLLGIGGRMPAELVHGQWRDMYLTIIGYDHYEYSTTLHVWTERLLTRPKVVQPRTSIFARMEQEAMHARRPDPGRRQVGSRPSRPSAT